jgi:hypothetical protein
MSTRFYSENEENCFEDSLNNYEFLFENYASNPPSLKDALFEMFLNAGASGKDAEEIYNDLYKVCNETVIRNWDSIKKEHPEISNKDALIISSYTYETKPMYNKYSPYRLLNQNLVSNDRRNGVRNVEKYFFIFLQALRRLNKSKKNNLFRCITTKVKLENDPNNNSYVPYKKGNTKTFWTFTSTSDNEKVAENFLQDGTGTKYKINGEDLWGYDITLFNVNKEKEILLEPEKKYTIENVEEDKITEVSCKIIDNPTIIKLADKKHKLIVIQLIQ